MAVKNYGIHDKWTNLDKLNNVDIKSVDGVIESVKINGEEAGGGGGSSDFSTAEVTIINQQELVRSFHGVVIKRGSLDIVASAVNESIITVVTYQSEPTVCYITDLNSDTVVIPTSVSGNIENDEGYLLITGDCTITIS